MQTRVASSLETSTDNDSSSTEKVTSPSPSPKGSSTSDASTATWVTEDGNIYQQSSDAEPEPENTPYPEVTSDSTYSVGTNQPSSEGDPWNTGSGTPSYTSTSAEPEPSTHGRTEDSSPSKTSDDYIYKSTSTNTYSDSTSSYPGRGMDTDSPSVEPEPSFLYPTKDMEVMTPTVMVDGSKTCTELLLKCSSILPGRVDVVTRCSNLPQYQQCMDNFFEGCTDLISDSSIDAAKNSRESEEKECEMAAKCPKLNECKLIYSNSLEIADDVFPAHAFCSAINGFTSCADQNLSKCFVTMDPQQENSMLSLAGVNSWFNQYCNKLVFSTPSLTSCNFAKCRLPIEIASETNSTYWCRLMEALTDCTTDVMNQCESFGDLEQSLETLRTDTVNLCMKVDDTMTVGPPPTPEGPDAIDPEASKDTNRGISLGVSFIFITILQVVVTAFLSVR